MTLGHLSWNQNACKSRVGCMNIGGGENAAPSHSLHDQLYLFPMDAITNHHVNRKPSFL